jgi:hypothetical protein
MTSLLFGIAMLAFTIVAGIRDARKRRIPFARYAGACLIVIAVAGGVGMGGMVLSERLSSETASTVALFASIALAAATSIWVAVVLFLRLERRYGSRQDRGR